MLAEEPIRASLKDGSYFNCDSVEQNGYFLDLSITVPHPNTGEPIPFRVSIPANFVLYMLSAAPGDRWALGFKD